MRTKLFFLAILLAGSVSGFSQVSIGIQGGGVYSSPKIKQTQLFAEDLNADSRFNWQAGLVADLPLGEGNFRFMPELNFVNKGFQTNTSLSYLGQPVTVSGNSNIGYVELPVNLGYAFDLGGPRLILGAGPYVAYGVTGKNKFKATVGESVVNTIDSDVKFGSGSDQIKPFDYGANLFAGLLINSGLMLKVNYSMGVANISNAPEASYKNSSLGATLVFFVKKAGQ